MMIINIGMILKYVKVFFGRDSNFKLAVSTTRELNLHFTENFSNRDL